MNNRRMIYTTPIPLPKMVMVRDQAPQDTRVQYPHKPRQRAPWEDRLATTDSSSRFLIMCEQSQAAYEARNPHKK